MAQRKQIATKDIKQSVTHALMAENRGKALAKVAKDNLAISATESWRTVTIEEKELVVARCYGGETVAAICKDLGLQPGHIYQLAYMDEEFAHRLAISREIGQHALVDKLLEIPLDKTMSTSEKELLSQNIKWVAARVAKSSRSPLGNYNERTEHMERSESIIINLPFNDPDIVI